MLPGQVVAIGVGIVDQIVAVVRRRAHAIHAADALVGESGIGLIGKTDTDHGVAVGAEESGTIDRNTFGPLGARESGTQRVDQRGVESVHPSRAQQLGGKLVLAGEVNGQNCRRVVVRR